MSLPWLTTIPWLSLLLVIPFLGTLALLLWPGEPSPARLRSITIAVLSTQLAASLALLLVFDPAMPGLQLQELHRWLPGLGLNYQLGVDGLSLPLVLINAGLTLVSAICTRDFSKRPRI
jgi:NAD(P)H-quinone oxidoreductase subunit 4